MKNLIYYLKYVLPELGYTGRPRIRALKGDGSDRLIFRVYCGQQSCILVHYPGGGKGRPSENDSFYHIGSHLRSKGLPSPEIYDYNPAGGQFLLEDFGDRCLEEMVLNKKNEIILNYYNKIIKLLVKIQTAGLEGFEASWCYDTPGYDGRFSWERESLYFIRAFLQGFSGIVPDEKTRAELNEIARRVDEEKTQLFLYRDFQSRNIMVLKNGFGLIDFQGGRLGPPQYDLASLLIDPYVRLSQEIQNELVEYFIQIMNNIAPVNRTAFLENYRVIGFQRNLQILGAFSFLSRIKGKTYFERYIPSAVKNLKLWINFSTFKSYRRVRRLIEGL